MQYIYIGGFVAVFNGLLFFCHLDIMNAVFGAIGTLQTFRYVLKG